MKYVKALIAIFVIILLAAFLKPSNSPANEVVFWTLQMNDFAPYITGVISEFEKENPEIKIKWIDVPFSEGEKRTLASVLSDNPPDLINLNPDFSALCTRLMKNILRSLILKLLMHSNITESFIRFRGMQLLL